ncbi:hypothetical protein ACFQRB_09925 [Halobaculum litoreum]|uniref:Uncharacterized protein n=1 Tax=Halobaculum litoreum TaxID=3031998 RepID=A0ABD5XU76_9EURY
MIASSSVASAPSVSPSRTAPAASTSVSRAAGGRSMRAMSTLLPPLSISVSERYSSGMSSVRPCSTSASASAMSADSALSALRSPRRTFSLNW